MIIKLYDLFGVDSLRNRETAKKIVDTISKESESNQITIDFDNVKFATRSFLNELLSSISKRKNIVYINRSEEIEKMMNISF
jgi:hypothetical protein